MNRLNFKLEIECTVISNGKTLQIVSFPCNAFRNETELKRHFRFIFKYGQLIIHVKQKSNKKTIVL